MLKTEPKTKPAPNFSNRPHPSAYSSRVRNALLLSAVLGLMVAPGCGGSDQNVPDMDGEDRLSEALEALAGDTNLALNKPATASSTAWGGVPSRAVDGNTDGNWGGGSIAHTDLNVDPWFQVDLLSSGFVGTVVLWPRTDCCTDRLSNFRIRVSDDATNWQDYAYPGAATPSAPILMAINRSARYVRLQLDGGTARYLNFAEMQVFSPPNLAQGKGSTQSSTYGSATASRANDGNTDGNFNNGSVSHTNYDANAWWMVDLATTENVGVVEVYNRTDGSTDRLCNFNVLVSDNGTTWTSFYYPGVSPAKTAFTVNRPARYVKVQLAGTNYMHLAEVKVYRAATVPNTATTTLSLNDDTTVGVGAVAGDFSVDAQGAATYSIPIAVPPGINNVEPKLSLSYRSGGGNGFVGVGWSLGGMSMITRCPRTIAQDGVKGGVNGDANDRFCLDGQRLIAISGTYGADGTQYRTEIESFSRVISYGTCGTGPCRFEVKDKTGNLAVLGETNAIARFSDGVTPRVYGLQKLVDPNGNYLKVSYQTDNNQLYPQEILYTLHNSAQSLKTRRVGFEYEGRTDGDFVYVAGTKIITAQRLSRIKTYVTAAAGEQLVREYRLGYTTSGLTKRSLLNTVTECDGKGVCLPATTLDYNSNGAGTDKFNVVMPTGTGWENYQDVMRFDPGARLIPADFDGDGRSDLIRLEQGDWATWGMDHNFGQYFARGDGTFAPWYQSGYNFTNAMNADEVEIYPFDYDGDGRTDFIRREKADWDNDASMTFGVYVAQYPGGFRDYWPGTQGNWGDWYQGLLGADGGTRIVTGDFNGDGRGDFIRAETGTWADNEPGIAFNVFFSTGNQGQFNVVTPTGGYDYGTNLRADYVDIIPGDFNGDGKTDFIRREKNSWDDDINLTFGVFYSRGDGYFDVFYPGVNTAGDIYQDQLRSDIWAPYQPYGGVNIIPGDFNGDGKTDFIRQQRGWWAANDPSNNFNVYFSTGKGGVFERVTPTGNGYGGDMRGDYVDIFPLDYNGDGKTDFLRREKAGWDSDAWYTLGVYVSRGDGTFDIFYPGTNGSASDIFQGACGSTGGANLIPADVDGDGKSDIIRQEWDKADDDTNMSFHVFFANGDDAGDYLKKVTNGLGGYVNVTYAPLNDGSVYSRDLVATYPNTSFSGAMYVVKSTDISDGRSAADTFTYGYANALMNAEGRGFLGFSTMWQSGPTGTSQTLYNQSFPLTGTIKEYDLFGDGYNSRVTTTAYSATSTYPGVYNVLPTSEVITHKEGPTSTPPVYYSSRIFEYDSYGNRVITRDYGIASDTSDNVETCTTWLNDSTNWWLSLPVTSTTADSCTFSNGSCSCSGTIKESITRAYSGTPNVTSVVQNDPVTNSSLTTQFTYDVHGNVLTKSTPGLTSTGSTQWIVETTTYDNDYKTYPTSQTRASGTLSLTSTFTYDARFGALAVQTEPNGNTVTNQYDGLGRLSIVSAKAPSGLMVATTRANYGSDATGKYRITNQRQTYASDTWRWEREYLDGKGRVWRTESQSTDPAKPIVVKREFDARNEVKKESLPFYLGDAEVYNTYTRDWLGRISQMIDASGSNTTTTYAVSTSSYTLAAIEEKTTEAFGTSKARTSTRYIDVDGRMISQTDADGHSTWYSYDKRGHLILTTDAVAATSTNYDTFSRVISSTSPDRGTITNSYNSYNGWLSQTTDGNGQATNYTYDALGRVTQKEVVGKQTITFTYDNLSYANSLGYLSTVTVVPAGQTSASSSNSFAYTYDGRIATNVMSYDGKSYTMTSSYDPQGRLIGFTYPDGSTLTRTYNTQGVLSKQSIGGIDYATYSGHLASGQAKTIVYASGTSTALTYDNATHLATAKTTAPGNVKLLDYTYAWDALHQITNVTDGRDNTRSQSFTYSTGGQLTNASGIYGSLAYAYDNAGNMTTKEGSTYTYATHKVTSGTGFTATYDTAGNRITQTRNGNSWAYTYDGENRVKQVTKNGAVVNQFAYDFAGERIMKTDANGTKTHYVTQNFEVTFLTDGRRLETKYINDAGGRVSAITTEFAASQAALLDVRGLDSQEALYDKATVAGLVGYLENRAMVLRVEPWAPKALFGFVSLVIALASFFVARKLASVKVANGLAKVRDVLLPRETAYTRRHPIFALAMPFVLMSFLAACNQAPGEHVGQTQDNLTAGANGEGYPVAGTYYFHNNYLASSAVVTNSIGTEVARTEYKPYGEIVQSASPGLDIFRSKFTGKEWDKDSELYFFHARHYDPVTGRFMSADSLSFGGTETQNNALNPYAYSNNNPVVYSDPSGHFLFLVIVVAVVIGAYAGGMATNGTWNPAQWNWNSWQTYVGMAAGGAVGGLSGGLGAQFGMLGAVAGSTLEAITCNGLRFVSPQGSTLTEFGVGVATDAAMGAAMAKIKPLAKAKASALWNKLFKSAKQAAGEAAREGAATGFKAMRAAVWKNLSQAAKDIAPGILRIGKKIANNEFRNNVNLSMSPINPRTTAAERPARADGSNVSDYMRSTQDAILSSLGADDMMGRVSTDWGSNSRPTNARGALRAPKSFAGFASAF